MGLMDGIDNAWMPYYRSVKNEYLKIKHLDNNKQILNRLNNVCRMGGIVPIYSSYLELDEIQREIRILYSKL